VEKEANAEKYAEEGWAMWQAALVDKTAMPEEKPHVPIFLPSKQQKSACRRECPSQIR
jgi:hypothetical protein